MSKKIKLAALPLLAAALLLPQALWAQESTTLDAVVVTSSRTEEKLREVTSNVTVISGQQIENSSATNLAQLLTQQGFASIDYGNSQYVQIRGMHSTANTEREARVLILINGRRTGITEVSPVGLNNIERVEVIRGPAAIQYGSSALGGVINIITKRGKEGEFWTAMETGLSSFDGSRFKLGLGGGINGVDFSGGVNFVQRDDYDAGGSYGDGATWPHSGFDGKTTMNLDLGYTFLEKHRVGLNFNYYDTSNAELTTSGFYNDSRSGDAAAYNIYNFKNNNLAFSYEGATRDDLFNWSTVYSFGKDEARGHNAATGKTNSYTNQDVQAFTGQVGYNGKMFSVNTGVDYNSFENKGTYDGTSKSDDLGFFVSTKLKLLEDSLIFSAAGRYDRYTLDNQEAGGKSESTTNFTPSVGVAYLPVDWLKLRANYSEGFLMPTAFHLVGGQGYYRYVGNPDIKPEESKTYEFGMDINWQAVSSSLTYFHTDWKNKVVSGRYKETTDYYYYNLNSSTLSGLEFSISADIGQMLDQEYELRPYFNLAYMLTMKNNERAQWINGDDRLRDVPKYTISYGLTFNHPGYDFMANINGTYFGEIFTSDYRSGAYPAPTIDFHPSTVAVDLSLEKGLMPLGEKGKLKLRAEVNNMFDDNNMIYFDYPGPGRNFYVGLKYEYK